MGVDTYVESQPVRGSGEGNLGALREVEDIAGLGDDLLTGLVRDLEFALQDNLHLVVRVLVDQRGTLLETVETARDRLLGVIRLTICPSRLSNRSNRLCDATKAYLVETSPRKAFSLAINGGLKVL